MPLAYVFVFECFIIRLINSHVRIRTVIAPLRYSGGFIKCKVTVRKFLLGKIKYFLYIIIRLHKQSLN